jgi:hypothetical protein
VKGAYLPLAYKSTVKGRPPTRIVCPGRTCKNTSISRRQRQGSEGDGALSVRGRQHNSAVFRAAAAWSARGGGGNHAVELAIRDTSMCPREGQRRCCRCIDPAMAYDGAEGGRWGQRRRTKIRSRGVGLLV